MLNLADYPWIRTTPNVWVILRLSQDDPDDPDQLAKHRSLLLRLAQSDGVTVPPDRVIEEIESGDTIAGRPRFAAVLQGWERLPYGAGGVVYSTEVARLTRGLQSDQGRVQDAMRRARLLHRTPARWYDLRFPEDATAWELEGFVARLELRTFRWRMALAADELLRQGRSRNGRPPYGYLWNPLVKEWEAHPDRFPVLVSWCRDIHTLSLRRLSARDGVSMATIHDTLTNPAICGWPVRRFGQHHGTKPWKSKTHQLPREEWQWPERAGRYLPACTRAEWEGIWAVLASRREGKAKTGFSTDGWCRDVVEFSGYPGGVILSSHGSPRGPYRTYERRVPGAPRLYVARELVHRAARAALARACRDPRALAAGLAAAQEEEAAARQGSGTARDERKGGQGSGAELARARAALDAATRLLVESGDPEERSSLLRIRGEKAALVRRLAAEAQAAAAAALPVSASLPAPADLERVAAAFGPVWEELEGEERRGLVRACLAAVPVEVVPAPVGWPHERRVGAVVYRPWLAALLGGGER